MIFNDFEMEFNLEAFPVITQTMIFGQLCTVFPGAETSTINRTVNQSNDREKCCTHWKFIVMGHSEKYL